MWDKGKAAVIWSETTVTDPDGKLLWTQKRSIFARGEGIRESEHGPSTSVEPPGRAPDLEVPLPILPQRALLYRLCGDRNPLHSDPEFAAAARSVRPILHGLCTYGVALQGIVDNALDGDMSRVHRYGARFAGVVFPGDAAGQHLERERQAAGHRHSADSRRCRRAGRRGADPDIGSLHGKRELPMGLRAEPYLMSCSASAAPTAASPGLRELLVVTGGATSGRPRA
jgi:acyl dehydratase